MQKIPVGATIAHAYRFAFGQALIVFKAIWLPLLASLAVALLLSRRLALFMTAMEAKDPSAINLFGPLLLLIPLLTIFYFAAYTATTEAALGRVPTSWFANHFNRPMWRLLGGVLGAIGVLAVVFVILSIVSVALGALLGMLFKDRNTAAILAGLFSAVSVCATVFIALRLLFLLGPVSVTEQRMGLRRSWQLSGGNFWRLLLVTLAIVIPVAILNQVTSALLGGLPPDIPATATKEARQAAETAWQISRLNAMAARWYLTLPLSGLSMWFQLGAGCAAQAFAYRKLTENSAPVAGDTLPD